MKKPYSRSHSTARPPSVLIWGGAMVFLVMLIIIVRLAVPEFFMDTAAPVWRLGTSLTDSTATILASFGSNQKLAEENASLASQNAALKNENAVLTARSQDLTKLLGGNADTSEELLAGVLAHPPESPYDTLIVDAGSSDGVTINAMVYTQGGIPIGTIKHVTSDTSQVSLYTSPGRSTDGWIGVDRTPITLTGVGAGAFTATLAKVVPATVGDTVYIPGPGAIPVGTLTRIESDPSSPIETLDIQPMTNLFSITWVEVARASS